MQADAKHCKGELLRILSPCEFFQNHLIYLVDIAAAQCNYQVSGLCMVTDIIGYLIKVFILSGIGSFRIAFILGKPYCTRNFFA